MKYSLLTNGIDFLEYGFRKGMSCCKHWTMDNEVSDAFFERKMSAVSMK